MEKELKRAKEALEKLKTETAGKITAIMSTIKYLRNSANELKVENAENIKDFLDVWPSLVNIYEYLGNPLEIYLIF